MINTPELQDTHTRILALKVLTIRATEPQPPILRRASVILILRRASTLLILRGASTLRPHSLFLKVIMLLLPTPVNPRRMPILPIHIARPGLLTRPGHECVPRT